MRRRLAQSFGALVLGTVGGFAVFGALSDRFPAGDLQLQSNLLTALLIFVVSAAGAYFVANPGSGSKSLWVGTLLMLTLGDLGRYFWEGNRVDQRFTAEERYVGPERGTLPLKLEVVKALRMSWPDPDLARDFIGGLDHVLPVANSFWPQNVYMIHKFEQQVGRARRCATGSTGGPTTALPSLATTMSQDGSPCVRSPIRCGG
jgi:hypothetical protein